MRTDFSNAKRVWFITDIHFGVRGNLVEWIDIQEDYFRNFFIPLVRKNYQPGDILMVGGDVFDSRNAINLRVMHLAISVFDELSSIFKDGIITILGNHDCYNKSSNEVNSLVMMKYMPNIHIYEDPISVKVGPSKFLLMPWRKNHEEEGSCVQSMGPGHDYLLCHADIAGMKFNKKTDVMNGCDISTYRHFKKVYCGHIHYAQKKANINMLGAPYPMTRSDSGNQKGITMLDLSTGEETYFENDRSPRFVIAMFDNILDRTPSEVRRMFANNFVDVYVNPKDMFKIPVSSFIDHIGGVYKELHIKPLEATPVVQDNSNVDLVSELSLTNVIKEYVGGTVLNDDDKKRLETSLLVLYKKAEEIRNNEKELLK